MEPIHQCSSFFKKTSSYFIMGKKLKCTSYTSRGKYFKRIK